MYAPSHFDESRPEVMHGLIGAHPLGTLVTHDVDGLGADHLPFEISPGAPGAPYGVLRAHLARANPLWKKDGEVMVVFQGPCAYVSPSLYEEKAISGKVVPTWNYAVVHAHGPLRAIDDPVWLLGLLARLSASHEAARPIPWKIDDAPREFIDKLLGAIVGIEIPVQRMQGKWKMSQNRSENDRRAISAETGMLSCRPPSLHRSETSQRGLRLGA